MTKTPVKNIVDLLKNKKVLFLENDDSLSNGLDEFEKILIENNIEYKCLFDLKTLEFEDIIKKIEEYDAIVFMTQWVYELSFKIKDYLISSKDKKIIIECYLSDPTFFYKPDVIHDIYIYSFYKIFEDEYDNRDSEKFFKLSDKPFWEYKNKFDK